MIPSEAAAGPEPFGKYLLDREIARGGMARVHLARLRGLGGFEKRLVVKQILPHLASDPRFVSMFVEEAKTLVQMSHPHIVPVYELGIVDGVYFLAMEYVEGATLADVLGDGPLDPAQVAHLGAQVCDALSYAHERFSIVHRDVTPRNVIVDSAGHCRLLDFGIAAPASGDGEGELFGTPGYLSPEQARGEAIGPRSDLFGVGAVLWHAWLGEAPFSTTNLERVRALVPGGDRERLADRPELDRDLAAIVDRALDPDPTARPESAKALGRSLRGWLASRHPEGVAPELGARAERARTRRDRARASDRAPAPSSARKDPTGGKIRTLAQSRALDEILEGTAPLPRNSAPRIEIPAEPALGTKPIDGRSGRHHVVEPPRPQPRAPYAVAALVIAIAAIALARTQTVDEPAPIAPVQTRPVPEPEPEREPLHETDPVIERVPVPIPPHEPGIETTTPRPARATVDITATSWAEITIDGRALPRHTPFVGQVLTAGRHTIVATNPLLSNGTLRASLDVPAGHSRIVVSFVDGSITIR